MQITKAISLAVLSLAVLAPAARSAGLYAASPGQQCSAAIDSVEQGTGIPPRLMAAIARVESGRVDATTGATLPWPWTIDVNGEGRFFDTKAEAVAAVRQLQAQGVRSIDVGCMQVNLSYHPNAFASLDQAFDPTANAAYAARFLTELHEASHDWTQAAALYHSATPALGAAYRTRVMAVWPLEKGRAGARMGYGSLTAVPPMNQRLAPHPVIGRDGLIAPTRSFARPPPGWREAMR